MIDDKDTIYVEHKAGSRGSQKVKKVRKYCDKCSKNCGYIFPIKGTNLELCSSCVHKKSYALDGKQINNNFYSLRIKVATPNGIIYTRSSYEAFFIQYLVENDFHFEYEKKKFIFKDGSSYLPDLYIKNTNEYIELKGLMRDSDALKLKQMEKEYPNEKVKVLRIGDLKQLGYDSTKYRGLFTIVILGDKWQYAIFSNRNFCKKFSEDDEAVTDVKKRKIYFNEVSIDLSTIIHELCHVYVNYLCLNSTSELKLSDAEEIFAEMFGKYGVEIFINAVKIYLVLTDASFLRNGENIAQINKTASDKSIATTMYLIRHIKDNKMLLGNYVKEGDVVKFYKNNNQEFDKLINKKFKRRYRE